MVEPSTARHEAHRGDSGFAEANAGLQPAAVLKPDRDNETSVIRGSAIRKAGWLNSNGAVKHTAACEKSYISGVIRKVQRNHIFRKHCWVLYQHDPWQALSISVYGDWRQQQKLNGLSPVHRIQTFCFLTKLMKLISLPGYSFVQ